MLSQTVPGLLLLSLLVGGALKAGVPARAADGTAPLTPPPILVRYLVFTATPRPGAVFASGNAFTKDVAVFDELQNCLGEPLTADPARFLAVLQQREPRYTFRLHLSGAAVPAGDNRYVIRGGPDKRDPFQFTIHDEITVLRSESPTTILTQSKGSLQNISLSSSGTEGMGWDDTAVPEGNRQVLSPTRSMGISGTPPMMSVIYVRCFSPQPR